MAGFCLASVGGNVLVSFLPVRLYGALLVSLLLYCAGLLQNDYCDLEEDREDRPYRPLPSRRINSLTAIVVACLLAAAGLLLAFTVSLASGVVAIILALVITIYNRLAKRIAIVGPIFMGVCRGLSLLLGASVLGWEGIFSPAIIFSAIFLSAFIAAVTHLAVNETDSYGLGAMRWGPALVLLVWFSGLYFLIRPSAVSTLTVSVVLSLLASSWAFYCGSLLISGAPSSTVQQTIGRFLQGLLLIQATMIALYGPNAFIIILILMVAWPTSQKLATHFYAS